MRPERRKTWHGFVATLVGMLLVGGCRGVPEGPTAPCLDCLEPVEHVADNQIAGRWNLYYEYDHSDREVCGQRAVGVVNGGGPPGAFGGLVMLVSVGLHFEDGRVEWQHDRPIRLVEGNRWATSVSAARLEGLRVELRGPCNGHDDDCDGRVDEGALPRVRTCGRGACTVSVIAACVDDCIPGEPSPEVCNGVDDDCDGAVDEAITPEVIACGGACGGEGARVCIDGVLVDECPPGDMTCESDGGDAGVGVADGDEGIECRLVDEIVNLGLWACNVGHDIGFHDEPNPAGVWACLDDNQRGCSEEHLEAWCNRAESEFESRWCHLKERLLLESFPECEVADTMRTEDGLKWAYCVDFAAGVCPESRIWGN